MLTVTSKDGTKIAFDKTGTGPAVIQVEGAMSYRGAFDPTLTQLAELLGKYVTVDSFDRRGRGDSGDTLPFSKDRSIQINLAAVGKAAENGYVERFMRTIKEEEVDLSEYQNFAEAVSQISRFIEDVYNEKRIHSSLGYLTPLEFEAVWSRSRIEGHSPSC